MKTEDFLKHEMNRRQFLGSSARNAAGVAAGMVGLGTGVAKAAPNERVSLAAIGIRSQGKALAAALAGLPDADVTVLCDVDENLLPPAVRAVEDVQGWKPRRERDFRRVLDDPGVDAVIVAAPDHWHAYMAIAACQAGKDVYLEMPVSHGFREGERILAAARKHGRVVQCGLQQRSGAHFHSAVELLRSGKLGAVHLARAWTVHKRKPIGHAGDAPVPSGVDYDLWLGPAPERAFNPNRFHHHWNWFWDYGAGELGNWGVHMLDLARWGLGVELPAGVTATGGKLHFDDDRETPDTLIATYSYPAADSVDAAQARGTEGPGGPAPREAARRSPLQKTIIWEHRLWSSQGLEGRSAAVAFYGELGTLIVDRGGWKVYGLKETLASGGSELVASHCRNFLDSMKSRSGPAADLEAGHVSSALCHLGNAAYRLGRGLAFDPDTGDCGEDGAANALLECAYRRPWGLPGV